MNVLLTGGAGYLGTELSYLLEKEPAVDKIVIYDNLIRKNYNLFIGQSKMKNKKVRFVQADILDSRKLRSEVERADVVFHLAAKVSTPFADHNPHEFDQINNWGTAELSYLIEESRVSRFIYTSSVSVYGASDEMLDIDTKPNPKTFYGISKLNGEAHVERLRVSRSGIFVLRLGNVYGYSKSMRFDSVINKFMFESHFAGRIRIFGDGRQLRSFIHIDRLVALLRDFALGDREPGSYNLVENTFSVNEIVDHLQLLYPDLERIYVNQNMKMRSLNVKPDARLPELMQSGREVLDDDLKSFRKGFSF